MIARLRAAKTLVDVLRDRANEDPDRQAFCVLDESGEESCRLSYRELDRRARAIGTALQVLSLSQERVLLLLPPEDFPAAFFGCLYAGATAVPAYPPDPTRLNRSTSLAGILRDAQAQVILTTSAVRANTDSVLRDVTEFKNVRRVIIEDDVKGVEDGWCQPSLRPDSLAMLQYTSGTTTFPRGVMLTHANLLANCAFIYRAFGNSPKSKAVVWVPPYHDMGLVGGILQPIYGGFPCTLMSPLTFLRRPIRWLRAISTYRATVSGGPNFAFDYCVRRIPPESRTGLDLSSWEVAFNGSELVRKDTMDAFADAFKPCGFHIEAFYPCYGLAEATLMVTGGMKERLYPQLAVDATALSHRHVVEEDPLSRASKTLVGCGRASGDHRVVIVDPERCTECCSEHVGEIWVSGPSVAQGYWRRATETEATFSAYTADSGDGPFLRTGDLGFINAGELFVTGRIKDVLVIRGRNYYPQDIESECETRNPSLRRNCGAAFTIAHESQQSLIVVYEVNTMQTVDYRPVMRSIRTSVARVLGLQVHGVVLVEPGSIPKTSSGKVQRWACRSLFLADRLAVVAMWQAGGPLRRAPFGKSLM